MNGLHFKYTDKEIKEILKTLVLTVDSREKVNQHVLDYFRKKDVPFVIRTIKTGDYSAYVPKNLELGFVRDTYFDIVVERKNSIDEFIGNIKEDRFENELIRSKNMNFILVIEDTYENLINGVYRSEYKPPSLLGRLKTFEARYDFNTVFVSDKLIGNFIYHHLYYQVRELLKK